MVSPLRHFLDPRYVDADGLVGITPAITPALLLEAYQNGIFPWSDRPARWYSPHPRSIFDLSTLRLPRRLLRTIRQERYQVSFDQAFTQVMWACAEHHALSWLSPSMIAAYTDFHRMGFAHSVEVWHEDRLVGGLYGVGMGRFFAGESMFFHRKDASKVAFFHLVEKLRALNIVLFDSQVINAHTASLGAIEIARVEYLHRLQAALQEGVFAQDWG